MPETPRSGNSAAPNQANVRLFDACRVLVTERGFGALSLRAVVRRSGWTMGELAYRVGTKDQLIEAYLDHELMLSRSHDQSWHDRLVRVAEFDGLLLAATIEAVIDDMVITDSGAVTVWHEAILEAANGVVPAAYVATWIDDRRAFWTTLLQHRVANAGVFGRIIADYVIAEQIYSVALATDPEYRLIRSASVARLCGLRGTSGWSGWECFLPSTASAPSWHDRASTMGRQAKGVADAAAQIILERGPSAITHRSVALALGQSSSAVAHHFGSRVDLVSAGFESLFHRVQTVLGETHADSSPGANLHSTAGSSMPAAIAFVRAMHIIALAAARDPDFVPLMLHERASRGRLIEAWYGEKLIGAHRTDRLLLQLISLVAGVRTLASALDGNVSHDGNRETLIEMLDVMG